MTFKKGHPRLGGKKKGYRSLKVEDVLVMHKFNPVAELLKMYPTLPEALKVKVCIELQSYLQAKPKPDTEDDQYKLMSTKELIVLVKEKLPELNPSPTLELSEKE